jgi:hypothetical protein
MVSASGSRLAISRSTISPPSDDRRPASNVAVSDLPAIDDRPGRNGVACMAMGGVGPVATRTLCFDTRMLRQTNGFVAAHHPFLQALMNKLG